MTMNKRSPWIPASVLLLVALAVAAYTARERLAPPAAPAPIVHDYEKYPYTRNEQAKVVDFATQPGSGYANGGLLHDRILQRQLADAGWTLREHGYLTGKEMQPYCDGRLDVMVMGDLPTITALAQKRVVLVAVARINTNGIIAKRKITPAQLKGLRIGYPPGTSAHFMLHQALRAAGLSMADIVPVHVNPNEMEQALRDGKVDAVSSWDHFAMNIVERVPGTEVILSAGTSTYILADSDFAAQYPEQLKAMLASVYRAARWSRASEENMRAALSWTRQSNIRFSGKTQIQSEVQWIGLMRKDTTENPAFPLLPLDVGADNGRLQQLFAFGKEVGLIPATVADWPTISRKILHQPMQDVVREREKWQLDRADYSPEALSAH
jgi:hypothetical protein